MGALTLTACGGEDAGSPRADAGPDAAADVAADQAPQDAGPDLILNDLGPNPCGDGVCDFATEDDVSCPQDCGCAAIACATDMIAPAGCFCDDCSIDLGDACADAASACGAMSPCGNGVCEIVCEDGVECALDCYCGNGSCDIDEDALACPGDCYCGDGICDFTEDSLACSADCYCGDGICDAAEDYMTCPQDC